MTIEHVAERMEGTRFLPELLSEYVDRGLGSLPGRETTITLVALLLKHHPEWKKTPPRDYELARLLRTSPRKIRNILDEISYRDIGRDDPWCERELIKVLEAAEQVSDGAFVTFQIDDGLVRDYARKLVRENYGVFEQGLSSSTVKVSGATFAALVLAVLPEDKQREVIAKTPPDRQNKRQGEQQTSKPPIRVFVDSFADAAGKAAGKSLVRLGFTLLTCGFTDLAEALELVSSTYADE